MIDPASAELTVGIVGAGAMGQGIAQVALTGGMHVVLHDAREGGAKAGLEAVAKRLDRLVEKGTLKQEDSEAAAKRASVASSLSDLERCHLVIEAVFEDLNLKRQIFAELEGIVSSDCVLASNTSSLLIASIARDLSHKGRIAGLHFFNPVPLMKLVEVVRAPASDQQTIDFLVTVGQRMGRTPVVVKDAPGFLVNFGGRAYTTEAMRLLHERVATADQIDAIMRDVCGFRMGPCELMDLTGVDVNYPVSRLVYSGYDDDPRLKTSFPHKMLLEQGALGRKTGQGHFRYDAKGQRTNAAAEQTFDTKPPKKLYLLEPDKALREFAATLEIKIIEMDDGAFPILAAPIGEDCTAIAARTGADARRLVAVDLVFGTTERLTVMAAPGADRAIRDSVAALLVLAGHKVTAIADSAGFVAPRIAAMVANLGCEMAQIGIASPEEIDLAMKLGLNYPQGPLELAETIGLKRLNGMLHKFQEITGEDRYRPSQWLRRRALLGLPIGTPD